MHSLREEKGGNTKKLELISDVFFWFFPRFLLPATLGKFLVVDIFETFTSYNMSVSLRDLDPAFQGAGQKAYPLSY